MATGMTGLAIDGTVQRVWIAMNDGVRLAASLYLPATHTPQPCLLEALPYRKDDLTYLGYHDEYLRLRDEHGYAVCRVDLRGTGSSEGVATDEYPVREQDDLIAVIEWLADQPWCDGNVGMWGTSYSGFNSLQVAARRPAALKAIVPIYATDDRYTDDVHYAGGALRLLDVVDYPTYMIAMNALPPLPELAGPLWRERWRERLEQTEPWLARWLLEQTDGDYWRHGSLRPDYSRITAATMIVGGWADGYRNNTFRTYEQLTAAGTPARLLVGPWSHMSTATSRPGPHLDLVPELAKWFDRWLRGRESGTGAGNGTSTGAGVGPRTGSGIGIAVGTDAAGEQAPIVYFVRESGPSPQPDASTVAGHWRGTDRVRTQPLALPLDGGIRVHPVRPDTGTAAWNSCAGQLPWGQPTDQRFDDAASLTWDWDGPYELLGNARLILRVAADQPVASVSAKLCDVAPDGTSTLITRGLLNLTHRDGHHTPQPLIPGEPVDVSIELEAAAYRIAPGRRLRLSLTGVDWPNTVAAPAPVTLTVHGDASRLLLPVPEPDSSRELPEFGSPSPEPTVAEGVTWLLSDDVLARTTTASTGYGSTWQVPAGTCTDRYTGKVSIDRRDWRQHVTAAARFELDLAECKVSTEVLVELAVTEEHFDLDITLSAWEGETVVVKRAWSQRAQRLFG